MQYEDHQEVVHSGVPLVKAGKAIQIYMDPSGTDYEGLHRVARSFASDVELITGKTPEVITDQKQLEGTVLITGSIGNNQLIDALIAKGTIDVSAIQGKRESYKIQVVENPIADIKKAVVVAGSDKLGTIYGIYHISERIGVSPWVFWGDVPPAQQLELTLNDSELNLISKEPSVKYRGFFLNDEWPSLGSWVTNKYGDFNEEFYEPVFQLLLRLKGNYMWPAMWSAEFSKNGKNNPVESAKLAQEYGIVMGTSHHEPLFRAGSEWQKEYSAYGESNLWDFSRNKEAITRFWEDGVNRNKDFANLITLGMRGEEDSALVGGLKENIALLKDVISTQKDILQKYGIEHSPQVLTIYKEVEQYWHGTDEIEGLKHWDVLDNVTIMLAEDNFGNVRTLPPLKEKSRDAGWGIYYHFDYHGGPVSYEWVNTVPLEKTWEQMSMAYDYGVRDVWIVNVGDLKPMEFPLSYFMNLAYDFDKWGTSGINRTAEYTQQWVKQQFGHVADQEVLEGIAGILADYTKMNGWRKPEVTSSTTYSHTHYLEAQRVLAKVIDIENKAKKIAEYIPDSHKDAYYQLVYYPAVASANVHKMQIYAGLNQKYAGFKPSSALANHYAAMVKQTIETDEQMQHDYNNKLSGGKWRGMMSSPHIGYKNWNAEGWTYPKVHDVIPVQGASMIVDVAGTNEAYVSGTASLPSFTNLGQEVYEVTISNGGDTPFDYKIETNENWIQVDHPQGTIQLGKTLNISVDWGKVHNLSHGLITITGAGEIVEVNIAAEAIDTQGMEAMTFVETNGLVSIEAEHTVNRVSKSDVEWKSIDRYGRTLSSVKMYPTTVSFTTVEDAPYLEYRIMVQEEGEYTLTIYTAPSNNLNIDSSLKYAVSIDDQDPVIADVLPANFEAGNYNNEDWCKAVMDNIHLSTTSHSLTNGNHVLRFYGLDAGLVLQKLVISRKPLPYSYFGPVESFYTK